MSERKDCEGIIQDVILIGAPCTAQTSEWNKFTRVVAGRIINGHCRSVNYFILNLKKKKRLYVSKLI